MTKTREELITWARTNPNVAALYAAIRSDDINHFSVVLDKYRREDVNGVGIAAYMLTKATAPREYAGGVEYYEEAVVKKYGTHYECLYKRGDAKPKVSKALNAGMKEHRTRLERMVAGEIEDVYAMHREVSRWRNATVAAKGVGISARKEPATLYYDQGEDEFACDLDTERKVRGGA